MLGLHPARSGQPELASAMSLSPSTVKVHVHNILQKTGHTNRQELIQDFWKTV
ncbi:MAG: LuxR C-terminal-related transcriptional regulator [Adlercreutzia equolifaciens]